MTAPRPSEGTPQVNFRAGPLAGPLAERAGGDEGMAPVAKRDLARYYALLDRTLRTIPLSRGEALAVCDALNGTLLDESTIPLLWASVDDVLADGLAEKWAIDGPALVARLRGLSYAQSAAVLDGVERWWRTAGETKPGDYDTTLRAVGLLR